MDNMKNKKQIFKNINEAVGLTPQVIAYYDEMEKSKIDMYIGVDRPDFGLTTYSTIGLSEYTINLYSKSGEEIRVEFISICNSDVSEFPNIIATCAFYIINSNYSCRPGTVYPNIVKEYYPNIEMEHIYFTAPYLWKNLHNLNIDDYLVTWLLAIPISDNEYEFLKENGDDALEDLLEKNNIDIFDITRKSVL